MSLYSPQKKSQMKLLDVNIKSFCKLIMILGVGLLTGITLLACSKKTDQTYISNMDEKVGEYIFKVRGADPAEDLTNVLDLLYTEESDERDIAEGILQKLWNDLFGGAISLFPTLDLFDQEYILLVRENADGLLKWILMLRSQNEKGRLEELLGKLHDGFISSFSLGVVRTRTLPSGKVFRDIVSDTEGVVQDEWKKEGFKVFSSHHIVSDKKLLHATKGGLVLISNDEEVLENAIMDPMKSGKRSLYAKKGGFERFNQLFPGSDVVSFLENGVHKDGSLSLSSWSCVP